MFKVRVSYRRRLKTGFSGKLAEEKSDADHIIVHAAPELPVFGKVFISYKEPEDVDLAELFRDLARLAGFSPYIAPKDLKPGTRIWREKIPKAIQQSTCMFVIWTRATPTGPGVRKEIRICRKTKVQDILILEQAATVPAEYAGTDKEYIQFHRSGAALAFAKVLQARRQAC